MGEQELVTLTIEDTEVSVPKGTTILEAAKHAGIVIPHYCYHPGLPVAGVCRMCLVEIEGIPNLQIGCATMAADGQNVRVYSDRALEARQSVLEFLLINHPLDCPICDQAGECELQNYVFKEGREHGRFTPEYSKRFDPVEDFGPDILYVANRCILCTRCVRFMEHVAGERVIGVSERGDRAFIDRHPDRQLDHQWAGNVVDLCPVGSLISKDFLHKARAWELDKAASVCTGCSQGCNVTVETRGNTVVRLRPRVNMRVNRYFMCDSGRIDYRKFNRGDRIEAPLVRDGQSLTATDWDHALQQVTQTLRGTGGKAVALVSAGVSTEAMFLLRKLLADFDLICAFRADRVEGEEPLHGVEGLALREERGPNATGARTLGYQTDFDGALEAVGGAAVTLVLGDALDGVPNEKVSDSTNLIYLGTVMGAAARQASVVMPIATTVEEDGTFVNRDGRVQRYMQAKAAPGMARPAWWVLGEALAEMGEGGPISQASEAFRMMAGDVAAFAGLTYEQLGYGGAVMAQQSTAEVSP